MRTRNSDAKLVELSDRDAIRDLACRYAHCVWRRDAAGIAELFSEDGEMDTGDGSVIRGRTALRETYARMLADADFRPFVHNHVFEVQGERATGTCYLDLRATVDGKRMIGSGCYEDEYVRVSGAWRFRSRRLELRDFVPLGEAVTEPAGEG